MGSLKLSDIISFISKDTDIQLIHMAFFSSPEKTSEKPQAISEVFKNIDFRKMVVLTKYDIMSGLSFENFYMRCMIRMICTALQLLVKI